MSITLRTWAKIRHHCRVVIILVFALGDPGSNLGRVGILSALYWDPIMPREEKNSSYLER